MKLTVDSDEFWPWLRKDIACAHDCVFIQTLSFEGDRVGKMLRDELLSSKAADIRIIVDSFTKWILSDKFRYSPRNLFNSALRREAKETVQMMEDLGSHGIRVKFTNPLGPARFFARNHKKLIVIDGRIAYLGGMNFSEHNFSWHDMMLRIEDSSVVDVLNRDFLATWNKRNSTASERFQGIAFHILDGHSNKTAFGMVLKLIEGAERQIVVESPYLTFPFSDSLRRARQRGVAVTIITPEANNLRIFKEYILWEAVRSDIEIRLYQGMTHLKAMLIDKEYLVIGSSNFDFLSYRLHQEIVVIVTDEDILSAFMQRVVQEDLKHSLKFDGKANNVGGHMLNVALRSFGRLIR